MRKLRTTELNRLDVEEFKSSLKTPVVIVLDNVRSLLNVGSVFRTSDAFRFSKILLCGITPTPSLEMNKTALGAIDSVEWEHFEDVKSALNELKEEGFSIFGIEQTDTSISLERLDSFPDKVAIVLGNEVKGVSLEALEMCDRIVEIPQQGTKHSLNVSVCGGIVSWELYKQLGVK